LPTVLIFSFLHLLSVAIPFDSSQAACAPPKTVILISVDGLGDKLLSDLHADSQLTEIERLAKDGVKANRVTTTDLMKTLPGHTSMLTGVSPDRHGITHNDLDDTLKPIAVPTLFGLLKDHGLKSAAVVGKRKIAFIIKPTGVDTIVQPEAALIGDYYGRLPSLIDQGVREEMKKSPAFIFVHYALGDTLGHIFQWGSWPQRAGLRAVDRSIGRLRKDADAILGEGQYVILLTADHGGHEGSHGQRSKDGKPEDLEHDFFIPWILYGMPMELTRETVTINDTAPTIANLLGVEVPKEWDWQGRASARLNCKEAPLVH
jgi:arylsulfatase A-like enzyme